MSAVSVAELICLEDLKLVHLDTNFFLKLDAIAKIEICILDINIFDYLSFAAASF
jgi:hypothetical protein